MKIWNLSRSIFSTAVLGFGTIYYSIHGLVRSPFHEGRYPESSLQMWCRFILKWARVEVRVVGLEKVPKRGVLFVFNHTSLIDIPVCQGNMQREFRFGAKIELYKIPFFGRAMKAAGALPIARQNLKDVIRVYEEARRRFANGESFMLAAEGTRQVGTHLGPFKSGPFILAIKAGAPVVPVVLSGVNKVLARRGWLVDSSKDHVVWVDVLDPVSTEGLTESDRDALKEKVRNEMVVVFERRQAAMNSPDPS